MRFYDLRYEPRGIFLVTWWIWWKNGQRQRPITNSITRNHTPSIISSSETSLFAEAPQSPLYPDSSRIHSWIRDLSYLGSFVSVPPSRAVSETIPALSLHDERAEEFMSMDDIFQAPGLPNTRDNVVQDTCPKLPPFANLGQISLTHQHSSGAAETKTKYSTIPNTLGTQVKDKGSRPSRWFANANLDREAVAMILSSATQASQEKFPSPQIPQFDSKDSKETILRDEYTPSSKTATMTTISVNQGSENELPSTSSQSSHNGSKDPEYAMLTKNYSPGLGASATKTHSITQGLENEPESSRNPQANFKSFETATRKEKERLCRTFKAWEETPWGRSFPRNWRKMIRFKQAPEEGLTEANKKFHDEQLDLERYCYRRIEVRPRNFSLVVAPRLFEFNLLKCWVEMNMQSWAGGKYPLWPPEYTPLLDADTARKGPLPSSHADRSTIGETIIPEDGSTTPD